MKRRIARLKLHVRAFNNLRHGYAFSSVLRCRACAHTVYPADLIGGACRYCHTEW